MLWTLFLCMMFVCPAAPVLTAGAEGVRMRLVDGGDLLSESEEVELSGILDEISGRQQVDIVVVTTDSLAGASAMEYADDFYDDNGYGFGAERDGVLLLVSIAEREWYVSTSGYGITAFTDAGLEYMSEAFLPDLSDGKYAEAFAVFAGQCDEYITQAKSGEPYDIDNIPKKPFAVWTSLFIAVAVGLTVSFIATEVMRHGLNSVCGQFSADAYVKRDGLQLTRSREMFLYRNIARSEIPRKSSTGSMGGSSTHRSSSGGMHGGRGGRF